MSTRCSELKLFGHKAKESVKTVVKVTSPILVTAAIFVNLYQVFAPREMIESQTCEAALAKMPDQSFPNVLKSTFIDDVGIFISWTTGVCIVGILFPTMKFAFKQVLECLGLESLYPSNSIIERINTAENEIRNALSTAILLRLLPIPSYISYPLLPLSAIPLIRLGLRRQLDGYEKPASIEKIRQQFADSPKTIAFLSTMESLYSGIGSSSALYSLSSFLFNVFYDSDHRHNLPKQNDLLLGISALGLIVGPLCTMKEWSYRWNQMSVGTQQIFWLVCMYLLSITFCLDQSLENIHDFMSSSIYVVLGVSLFSMGYSAIHTLNVMEEEKELHHEEVASVVIEKQKEDSESESETPEWAKGTTYKFFSRRYNYDPIDAIEDISEKAYSSPSLNNTFESSDDES